MSHALRYILLLACLAVCTGPATAQGIKIFISSGTGFFVSEDGYALTNYHVVKHCEKITLAGAGVKREAKLVDSDPDQDLALLKTGSSVGGVAQFRHTTQPIEVDDRVVIIGYPGESFKTGDTITREATILALTGPKGEEKWLQLSDVVVEGNSGGPLLDTSGNVAGIVSAKALIYTYREDEPDNGVTSRTGIAVNSGLVQEFLDDNGVRYRSSDSGIYLSADRITDNARSFIVNVLCQLPPGERQ